MSNGQLVSKVWNYAHVLRDQSISYGDYIEQTTYPCFCRWMPSGRSRRNR
jgi:type I restriction enzyme M protein